MTPTSDVSIRYCHCNGDSRKSRLALQERTHGRAAVISTHLQGRPSQSVASVNVGPCRQEQTCDFDALFRLALTHMKRRETFEFSLYQVFRIGIRAALEEEPNGAWLVLRRPVEGLTSVEADLIRFNRCSMVKEEL